MKKRKNVFDFQEKNVFRTVKDTWIFVVLTYLGFVLITVGVTTDADGGGPSGDEAGDSFANDRFAEYGST